MKRKFKLAQAGDVMTVDVDFNMNFVLRAHELGGRYKDGIGWIFDAQKTEYVLAACADVYGTDGLFEDVVDVIITIPKDNTHVSKAHSPIAVFGWVLARAWGRDTGAKLGEGVTLLSGGFSSGGSQEAWYTQCEDGTEVLLKEVARSAVEKHNNPHILVKIINDNIDINALNAEKARLVTRLCAINDQLERTTKPALAVMKGGKTSKAEKRDTQPKKP